MQEIDRRSFTALTGLAAVGAAFGIAPRAAHARAAAPARALRFAHFTDLHITPDRDSESGMIKAFESAHAEKIEMILTGGDLIMDSYATKRAQVDREWTLLHKLFAEHCKVPVEHCLGNHDVFGWCRTKAEAKGDGEAIGHLHARYGEIGGYSAKARVADVLHGLGFTDADRVENVRRVAEVGRLMVDIRPRQADL